VTGSGLEDWGLILGKGRFFSFPSCLDQLWDPPSLSLLGELKGPEYEADQSPPSSAEVKNVWSFACTLPYALS